MKVWIRAGFLPILLALFSSSAALPGEGSPSPPTPGSEDLSQTKPGEPEEDFVFEPAPEPAIPDEYVKGIGYLGGFRDAWGTEKLFDPINARLFLALQNGADRKDLASVGVPDLDLALQDLIAGRMVRESSDGVRPAFPLIREAARKPFNATVQSAAEAAYAALRPSLKKIRNAAEKEKVLPWLYTLLWSEMLESRAAEASLAGAGALKSQRLRDEGYLWILIPGDPYSAGVDRYSSGKETLHYLWTATSYLNPVVEEFSTRRQILDRALNRLPWEEEGTAEALTELGVLDAQKRVRVPVLRQDSKLLAELRKASRRYAKKVLASLEPDALARLLGASRDEAIAAEFSAVGFRFMEHAVKGGFLKRPEYLFQADSPMQGLVEALVITENEQSDPLERAYYLYDREDFEGAIRQADLALNLRPGDPETLFRKGISYMKLRKYPEALQNFEQAASRPAGKDDVWRGWTLVRIGNVLDMMGRREEALKRYDQALHYADVGGSRDAARAWLENVYHD
jgi:tetratricopeptide (TPR) repeat protein